jgi:hypothetical protein
MPDTQGMAMIGALLVPPAQLKLDFFTEEALTVVLGNSPGYIFCNHDRSFGYSDKIFPNRFSLRAEPEEAHTIGSFVIGSCIDGMLLDGCPASPSLTHRTWNDPILFASSIQSFLVLHFVLCNISGWVSS